MSINMNQFKQKTLLGSLDLTVNPNPSVYTVRHNPKAPAANTLVAGEGVIFKDLGSDDVNGVPVVDKRAADADAISGVVVYSTLTGEHAVGQDLTIATTGAVITMKASSSISRGASVALVLSDSGEVVTRTTETILGIALDKANATNDLIRVKITA
jgi:hypothetical protein